MYSIIASSITTLGAFMLVYLSVVKDRHLGKYEIVREQLDNFYIPFYRLYCRGFLERIPVSDLSTKSRGVFLDLLSDNIHYMEPDSQALYSSFYLAYLNLLEAENGNPAFEIIQARLEINHIFADLEEAVFKEYKQLLKKAKLPVPKI